MGLGPRAVFLFTVLKHLYIVVIMWHHWEQGLEARPGYHTGTRRLGLGAGAGQGQSLGVRGLREGSIYLCSY